MPAPQDLAYNISISSLDSWDKLVTWYTTLIREQDKITPDIAEKNKATPQRYLVPKGKNQTALRIRRNQHPVPRL